MRSRYYGMDGQPISRDEWARIWKGEEEDLMAGRRVGYAHFGDYSVSTVLLGLDHNYTREGPPLIFETMIFGGDFADREYQERYATKEQAEEGHLRACRIAFSWWRRKLWRWHR